MIEWCGLVFIVVLLPLQVHSGLADLKITEQVTQQAKEVLKDCRLTLQTPCPDNANIVFNLYTRKNQRGSQHILVNESKDNIKKSFFNPEHPNKVIIHGLQPKPYLSHLVSIKDAYLSKEDTNVWTVDWSKLAANGVCLALSLTNTEHVAKCTAQLITAIKRHAPESHIHVVAYRAGVKVAHELSEAIKPLRLNRLTGLSPKGGKIPTGNDFYKLNAWDAEFIDTIHTSSFLPNNEIYGHVDFYVNPNLAHQPGCEKLDKGKSKCDQARALQYFSESITTEVGFLAWECRSYTEFTLGTCHPHEPFRTMGESCPVGASGIYIVFTAENSPYALGHWDGDLYKERGPNTKFNMVSKSLTSIKNTVEQINEKTPEILKELGLVDIVKNKFEDKLEELSLKGVKALTNLIIEKKLKNIEGLTNIPDPVESKQ